MNTSSNEIWVFVIVAAISVFVLSVGWCAYYYFLQNTDEKKLEVIVDLEVNIEYNEI